MGPHGAACRRMGCMQLAQLGSARQQRMQSHGSRHLHARSLAARRRLRRTVVHVLAPDLLPQPRALVIKLRDALLQISHLCKRMSGGSTLAAEAEGGSRGLAAPQLGAAECCIGRPLKGKQRRGARGLAGELRPCKKVPNAATAPCARAAGAVQAAIAGSGPRRCCASSATRCWRHPRRSLLPAASPAAPAQRW